jgi:hypothetical protein
LPEAPAVGATPVRLLWMLDAACRRNTLSSSLFAPHAVTQLAASTPTQPAASTKAPRAACAKAPRVTSTEAVMDRTPDARSVFGFDALVWDIEVILI